MSAVAMAQSHRSELEALSLDASRELQGMWRNIDEDNIRDSWLDQVPRATATVALMQRMAAETSESYTRNVLEEQGISPDGPRINPDGFSGMSYPMRPGASAAPLQVAMAAPAYMSLQYIGQGHSVDRSMTAGLLNLVTKSQTAITDAGRNSELVTSETRNRRVMQVRVVQPGACDRCIILAGRTYRNAEFLRHPSCQCTAMPSSPEQASQYTTDPYEHFRGLSAEQQDKAFGQSNAQAIRDGADIFQVTNARMEKFNTDNGSLSQEATYYGITRRANWGRQQRNRDRGNWRATRVRLTPDQIYRNARETGGDPMPGLVSYGYVLPQGQRPEGVLSTGWTRDLSENLAHSSIHR